MADLSWAVCIHYYSHSVQTILTTTSSYEYAYARSSKNSSMVRKKSLRGALGEPSVIEATSSTPLRTQGSQLSIQI